MKKIKDNLLSIYIIINLGLIFLTSYLSFVKTAEYKDFLHLYEILLFLNIFIFIVGLVKKKLKLHIYDFFLLLMAIFGVIATIFAIKSDVSLYGFMGRYEGLFSLLYYYSIFLLSSLVDKEKRKPIIYTLLGLTLIEVIYGILQYNGLVKTVDHDNDLWITGFTWNPNFLGTITVISLCYSLGLFIESSHLRRKIIYGLLIIMFLIGLLLSNTTSCVVALIFIILYLIYYCIKNKKINELLVILILIINTTFIMNQFGCTTIISDLIKTKNETVEIAKGHVDDYYGTRRIKIWKETLKIVPKYMVHGAGIDNFFYAFGKKPLIIKYYMYDKAHNEYLQILLTEGIFALISYLLFYLSVFLIGYKNNHKKNIYLVLPVVAYLIQAFFNISVVEAAPIFFMSLGLLIDRNDKDNTIYKKYIKRLFDIIISLILLIVLCPLFLIISILIKLDSKGSIFYKQKRTGINGKEFNILKFRTMDNKKVTKIGKFLRNSSIDELPQLINVLKGDMSLIGPRPWITDYYKNFNKKQKRRVEVKPGIIGLAQVNGRNNISVFEKIDYDLEYVDKLSFLLDLKILFNSFKAIFIKEDIKDMDKYIEKELKELSKKNKHNS